MSASQGRTKLGTCVPSTQGSRNRSFPNDKPGQAVLPLFEISGERAKFVETNIRNCFEGELGLESSEATGIIVWRPEAVIFLLHLRAQ